MRLTGHAQPGMDRPPRAGGARVGDRGPAIDPDVHQFVVCMFNVFAALAALALLALVVATLFWVASAKGQVVVTMQRADPAAGMQEIDCYLVPRPDAARIITGAVLIDCRADAEAIFHNSFEAAPPDEV